MLGGLGIVAVLTVSLTTLAEIPRDGQQTIGQHSGDNTNKQQAAPQPASIMAIPLRPSHETNGKTESKKNDTDKEAKNWTTSDKIAIIAAAAGVFQFLALIATILTMHWFGRRQLRAYMVLRRGGLFLLDGDALKLTLEVENSGQTPAYEIQGRSFGAFSSYPMPEPLQGNQCFESKAIVGGGRSFTTGGITQFTQKSIEALRGDEKRAFFIVGKYTYVDIFKEEHRVRFQLFVGGPGGVQIDTDGSGNKFYVAYPDAVGNEAD
jgi:hypothetical protein